MEFHLFNSNHMDTTNHDNYVEFVVTARKYKTLLTKKYRNRPVWQKHQPGDVISTLPGTIVEISVVEKQTVEEGQILLVLEAMKMMNQVVSPVSGTIKNIYIKPGDKIGKNHLMMKIEPK